jgi:hypothetical protein
MSQDYLSRKTSIGQRTSSISSVVLRPHEESDNNHRTISATSGPRHLSTVSQIYLPRGSEYYPQERVPPTGPEVQQPFILTTVEDDQSSVEQSRFSILTRVGRSIDEDIPDPNKEKKLDRTTRRILFFIEPIIGGLILFPIIALFWESGWSLVYILLNLLNKLPSDLHSKNISPYTWQSLVCPYLIVQFILLLYYLCQNLIYNFLKDQNRIVKGLLLKFHIFLLATIYIIQWEMLWTIWDEFIPHEWYFELTLSLTALFAFIVFNGHLSDLVCAPFLYSYDSIEYCIHFGCPLLTRDVGLYFF